MAVLSPSLGEKVPDLGETPSSLPGHVMHLASTHSHRRSDREGSQGAGTQASPVGHNSGTFVGRLGKSELSFRWVPSCKEWKLGAPGAVTCSHGRTVKPTRRKAKQKQRERGERRTMERQRPRREERACQPWVHPSAGPLGRLELGFPHLQAGSQLVPGTMQAPRGWPEAAFSFWKVSGHTGEMGGGPLGSVCSQSSLHCLCPQPTFRETSSMAGFCSILTASLLA